MTDHPKFPSPCHIEFYEGDTEGAECPYLETIEYEDRTMYLCHRVSVIDPCDDLKELFRNCPLNTRRLYAIC